MGRVLAGMLVVLVCCAVATTALAKKGFYIGGGFGTQSASGDLDGKGQVTTAAGDRLGSFGKLESGSGNDFDIGYNFNPYFGLEYFSVVTQNNATHQFEANDSTALAASALLGVRLTAPMANWLEGFLRVGNGASIVRYEKYGHKGTTTGNVFTASSEGAFEVVGTGLAYGLGLEFYAGQHIGIGFGYTVFNAKYNRAQVAGDAPGSLAKALSETLTATDLTFAYHF
jgi:hypothetical protein